MKTPNVHLAVYWGPRPNSLDECVRRVISYYDELRNTSAVFAHWRETGKKTPNVDTRDETSISHLLLSGRNPTSVAV